MMSLTRENYGKYLALFRKWVLACLRFVFDQLGKLLLAVWCNFRAQNGETGWRSIWPRFVNLWGSGWYGKVAIALFILFLYQIVTCAFSDDSRYLIPQKGNYPKSWYARFEEEPYGLIGTRGIKPDFCNTKTGDPVFYEKLPALSEIKSAFTVRMYSPYQPIEALGCLPNYRYYDFPPASDRQGRIKACEDLAGHSSRVALDEQLWNLHSEAANARIEAAGRQLDNDISRRKALDRQHDYNMSRASGMTLRQYETYKKNPDAVNLDRNGYYRGADGKTYEIDANGFKWWHQNGVRGESH